MELSPHPLTNLEFVNVLIESEQQEKRLGWEECIVFYGKAKVSAEVIHHAKKGKIPEDMNLEMIMNDLLKNTSIS